jgi:pimeloyl-ACP methyl ester carboxylesterase
MLTPLLLALPVAGYAGQRWAEARDRRRFPAPGRFVDVDGVRLHVLVEGSGPLVVIDSGLGGSCIEWETVAASLRDEATVVRYDRPGFGWSPAAVCDRSPRAAAERIVGLLDALELEGPAVLVGHSLGGLHVRLVASLHPDRVVGLVLVDPSHEDMLDAAPVPAAARVFEKVLSGVAHLAPLGLARVGGRLYGKQVGAQLRQPLDDTTRTAVRTSTLLTSCSVGGLRAAVAELTVLPTSLKQVREVSVAYPLPPVPLTLITAGAEPRNEQERTARELIDALHQKQVAQSPRGRQVYAGQSGHLVPLDEPELVASCIRETLVETR